MYPKCPISWPVALGEEFIKCQRRTQALKFLFQSSKEDLFLKGGIQIAASVSKYPGAGPDFTLQ